MALILRPRGTLLPFEKGVDGKLGTIDSCNGRHKDGKAQRGIHDAVIWEKRVCLGKAKMVKMPFVRSTWLIYSSRKDAVLIPHLTGDARPGTPSSATLCSKACLP